MPKFYIYKLTADTNGAPCVDDGLLSLAICKPEIRRTAKCGDIVFGFTANSLDRDNRLIYIAEITEYLRDGRYYTDRRFANRGDRIYRKKGDQFLWRIGALHHGQKDILHDLGNHPDYLRANVLLSNDFRYFGKNGNSEYKSRYPYVRDVVDRLGRGYLVRHSADVEVELLRMKNQTWKSTTKLVLGPPTSPTDRAICHR